LVLANETHLVYIAMAVETALLSQVLESHDRLIGVIDSRGGLVQGNERAHRLLVQPDVGAGSAPMLPHALADAADDARERGVVRRGVLLRGGVEELFLHGHFWPMDGDCVGFALRSDVAEESAQVAGDLGIPPWHAAQALRAAQQLSDREIASALVAGGGNVTRCLELLAAAPRWGTARAVHEGAVGAAQHRIEIAPPEALSRNAEPDEGTAAGTAERPPRSGRVLCVLGDSEESFGERLSSILDALGHHAMRVVTAEDARHTLGLFTETYFHTVLVNLDMPGDAAIELAQFVRRERSDARLSFYSAGGASAAVADRARRLAPVLPRPERALDVRRTLDHATKADRESRRRPRFASGSRPSMRLRAIFAALRRGHDREVVDASEDESTSS